MKKLIIIGIAAAVIVSAGMLIALKVTLGDQAIEILGEESIEKNLNLQEENERGEYGENEANEIDEYGQK